MTLVAGILTAAVMVGLLASAGAASAASYTFATAWPTASSPEIVHTDATGNLYVTSCASSTVQEFSPTGALLLQFGSFAYGPNGPPGTFNCDRGAVVGPSGDIYVADLNNYRIQEFTPNGAFVRQFPNAATRNSNNAYQDLAVDSAGNVYGASSGSQRIDRYKPDGTSGTVVAYTDGYPSRLFIDPANNVWVTDFYTNVVQEFSPSGTLLAQWGGTGTSPGQFNGIGSITQDAQGSVYVSDSTRVQVLTTTGSYEGTVGSAGTDPGQFSEPDGLTAFGKALYVVDDAGQVIKYIINSDTTPPTIIVPGTQRVEATGPSGTTVNYASLVGVTDPDNEGLTASCEPISGSTFPLGTTTVTCNASDSAGNQAAPASFNVVVQDTTPPTLSLPGTTTVTLTSASGTPVTFTTTATDLVDGSVPVTCSPASGSTFPVGSTTVSCSATDNHGNKATGSFVVKNLYRWDGFLQPINDTAHNVGEQLSIFKAGSTVPVKFQLKTAEGTVAQAASLPLWIAPVQGGAMSGSVDESTYSDPASSASTFRWDSTSQQYIFNWATAKSMTGYYWRIGAQLPDGTVQTVIIGLH